MRRLNTILFICLLVMNSLLGQNIQSQDPIITNWPDVKDKIYPMIKQKENDDDTTSILSLNDRDELVIDPYMADLHIAYLIDDESYYTYVNSGDLKQWKINKDSLAKTALENLNNLANGRAQFHGDSTYGMIVLNGNLEASLMLSDGFWEAIAQTIKQKNLVIAIPARDVLLVTHLESSEGILKLKQAIDKIYEQGDQLITKSMFKRENGVWLKY